MNAVSINLAKAFTHYDDYLDEARRPQEVLDHYVGLLKKMGYRFIKKPGPKSWKRLRASTTLKKTIWLGNQWDKKTTFQKAVTMVHEHGHAVQARKYKGFFMRYVFDERFRIAMETQAYRESIRALRSMGLSEAKVFNAAKQYRASMLRVKSYAVMGKKNRHWLKYRFMRVILTKRPEGRPNK